MKDWNSTWKVRQETDGIDSRFRSDIRVCSVASLYVWGQEQWTETIRVMGVTGGLRCAAT